MISNYCFSGENCCCCCCVGGGDVRKRLGVKETDGSGEEKKAGIGQRLGSSGIEEVVEIEVGIH